MICPASRATNDGLIDLPTGELPVHSISDAIHWAATRLSRIADKPRHEARLLLAHALGVAQTDLIRDPRQSVRTDIFERLLARREAREPMALILGHREFWSMEFLVSPATLIPRADSETLVEAALGVFAARPPPRRILDLGTGTGCLMLALLQEFPTAFGIGTDITHAAAALAQCNATRLGLADRSAFVCGDWTEALDGRFDLVVSNPPYIPARDIAGLMPEVARYEPRQALDGGVDGIGAYRFILPGLRQALSKDGVAILEVGAGQADIVAALAGEWGFEATTRSDLAGIARAIVLSQRIA